MLLKEVEVLVYMQPPLPMKHGQAEVECRAGRSTHLHGCHMHCLKPKLSNGGWKSVSIELRSRVAGKGVGEVDSKAHATQTRQRHDLTSLVGAKTRATLDTNLRVFHPSTTHLNTL